MVKITYTADDGTTFEEEEACLLYERRAAVLSQLYDANTFDEDTEQALGFQPGFLMHIREFGFDRIQTLLRFRPSLLRLALLLDPES